MKNKSSLMMNLPLLFAVMSFSATVLTCDLVLAQNDTSEKVDGNGEKKITICHIPPGNPENAQTITIGEPALQAHLDHGDKVGACEDLPEALPEALLQ